MFFEVRDNKTHKLIGTAFVCHGCGDKSPVRKQRKLPSRWTEKTELAYGDTGQRRRGMGWVVNYYCPVCHSYGVTAHTVAATTRKLCRTKLVRDTLNPKTAEKKCETSKPSPTNSKPTETQRRLSVDS